MSLDRHYSEEKANILVLRARKPPNLTSSRADGANDDGPIPWLSQRLASMDARIAAIPAPGVC